MDVYAESVLPQPAMGGGSQARRNRQADGTAATLKYKMQKHTKDLDHKNAAPQRLHHPHAHTDITGTLQARCILSLP